MALMDKLGDLAKKGEQLARGAADKAGDFIEQKKDEAKIAAKNLEIAEVKAQIGEYYYQKYLKGEEIDLEPVEYCGKIQQLLNDIELIKNDGAAEPVAPGVAAKFCQNCGTALADGAKFCPSCGMKAD